jgi:hypothetical protein
MRPIERKFYQKINEKGFTRDDVLEFLDRLPPEELKKSFPDDCLFQTDKYFAKIIIESLIRNRLIRKDGNRFVKLEKEKKQD